MDDRITELLKAFEYGVDYGLLIAEEERDSEDVFDAFLCSESARKFNAPSAPARRRLPHSEEWRKQKRDNLVNFYKLLASGGEVDHVQPQTDQQC